MFVHLHVNVFQMDCEEWISDGAMSAVGLLLILTFLLLFKLVRADLIRVLFNISSDI